MPLIDLFTYQPKRRNELLPFQKSCYTFKHETEGLKNLAICPKSFEHFVNDLSFKENLGYKDGVVDGKTKGDMWQIINNLPTIQIREIAQDSRMQEIGQWFKAIESGWELGKSISEGENVFDVLACLFKHFVERVFSTENGIFTTDPGFDISQDTTDRLIFNTAFRLYYMMIGQTTLNYYELPCDLRALEQKVDSVGWGPDGAEFGNFGQSSILGKALSFVGAQFATQLQPRWNPGDTAPQTVSTTFSLFNDTAERAMKNLAFINTIVPGAMTMQYSIVKHAPNVYDVKVSGFTRMFMCSCNVSVKWKGNVRRPSKTFVKNLQTICNPKYKDSFLKSDEYDLVRIPDIYEVTLNFTSLLPHNLNNYLFMFIANKNLNIRNIKSTIGMFDEWDSTIKPIKDDIEKLRKQYKSGADAYVSSGDDKGLKEYQANFKKGLPKEAEAMAAKIKNLGEIQTGPVTK